MPPFPLPVPEELLAHRASREQSGQILSMLYFLTVKGTAWRVESKE